MSRPSTWSPIGRAIAAVAAVVALNTIILGVDFARGGEPGGPAMSTFGTAEDGLAGLARLYEADGRSVTRLRQRIDQVSLDEASTLFVPRPDLVTEAELGAIEAFLARGGTVISSGFGPTIQLAGVPASTWAPLGGPGARASVVVPIGEARFVDELALAGPGRWRQTGTLVPLFDTDDGVVVAAGVPLVGGGRLVAIADPGLFSNEWLSRSDNAAFALAAAASPGGSVVFAEATHGYVGWRAVPQPWLWALGLGALGGLTLLWAHAVRFGPPDRRSRELAPPRRIYAESVGRLLVTSTARDEATEPLRRRWVDAERRAAAVPSHVETDPVSEASELLRRPARPEEVLTLGRLAARRERDRTRRTDRGSDPEPTKDLP